MRRDAVADERIDLILHQRNEGRNNDGDTGVNHGGRLKAQRLSASGRQHNDGIATGKYASIASFWRGRNVHSPNTLKSPREVR